MIAQLAREDRPALVVYSPHGRAAAVLHEDGPDHENAIAAVARLERQGFRIVAVPPHYAPWLAGLHPNIAARAVALIRAERRDA